MKVKQHTQREFAAALQSYLPPGLAWKWPEGGFGDKLLMGAAQEFARTEAAVQQVLDNAVERHRPKVSSWHIDEYRRVALEAIGPVVEAMPRQAAAIGGHIGDRLWSHNAPNEDFPIDLIRVEQLLGPARIGNHIGDAMWGHRSRAVIRVRYYRSVVDPKPLWDALAAFKQAHIFLWFEDISGAGGQYGQN